MKNANFFHLLGVSVLFMSLQCSESLSTGHGSISESQITMCCPAWLNRFWFQNLIKFRFLMAHCRKNSEWDKVIGKMWIYSERNTLRRQSVGHRHPTSCWLSGFLSKLCAPGPVLLSPLERIDISPLPTSLPLGYLLAHGSSPLNLLDTIYCLIAPLQGVQTSFYTSTSYSPPSCLPGLWRTQHAPAQGHPPPKVIRLKTEIRPSALDTQHMWPMGDEVS